VNEWAVLLFHLVLSIVPGTGYSSIAELQIKNVVKHHNTGTINVVEHHNA
jgi:hypothetical protein